MPDILSKILAVKCSEVADLADALDDFKAACRDAPPTRRLADALRRAPDQPMRVVAEIKRRSPSARTASATRDVMSSISTRDRVLTVNVCTVLSSAGDEVRRWVGVNEARHGF